MWATGAHVQSLADNYYSGSSALHNCPDAGSSQMCGRNTKPAKREERGYQKRMTAETATHRVSSNDSSGEPSSDFAQLLHQYGCGPIPFMVYDALSSAHLVFDRVIDPKQARSRARFEALARSIRDVLAQRWVSTKQTYVYQNPKRVYYLSSEFLIGRSLANNITNLLLDPFVQSAVQERNRLADLRGAGCRTGQRRSGTPCGLLPLLDCNTATACHGLWPPL